MAITVTPIDATLGAVVTDVDLAKLADESWAEIHAAFLEYGVLVFPGPHLDEESQGAFARRFDTNFHRVLRATRISGEPETELASTFADPRADAFRPTASNRSSLVS